MASFDLATEPWIPVRYMPDVSGPSEVGFVELFSRAHEIADIALPIPPAASGLWRILYLIAARITGLDDLDLMEDWPSWKRDRRKVLESGRFDQAAIDGYFTAHSGRFDLFSPDRPWLQDPRLAAECAKSTGINKLAIGRAAGNNQVWLSHHTDLDPQPVRAAEATWYLIAWLYYGPSGKITARTVGTRTESNMTAGPLRSRISFHPLADSLFASLIAGIPYLPQGTETEAPDRAPWEDDELPNPLDRPPSREGLSGVLTGQFRHALLLTPSPDGSQVTDARITWAWRAPSPDTRDPFLIYDTSKNSGAQYARYARFDRAIWRDLDALLLHEAGQTSRPAVFDRLPDGATTGTMRVRAYGFDQDGQVKDHQWFAVSTPPVLTAHYAVDDAVSEYDDASMIGVAREAAERVGDDLRLALRRAWAALGDPSGKGKPRAKDPDPPWLANALGQYWKGAETAFWRMVNHQQPFDYPSNTFIEVARKAYDQVTDTYGMRRPGVVVRALERARSGIFASWSRPPSSPPEASDA